MVTSFRACKEITCTIWLVLLAAGFVTRSLQTHQAGYARRSRLADGQNSCAISVHVIPLQALSSTFAILQMRFS